MNSFDDEEADEYVEHVLYDEEVAMENAYMLITRKLAADKIMDLMNSNVVCFPFNPVGYNNEDIQGVMDYYAQEDNFEKCIELKKYKKNGKE